MTNIMEAYILVETKKEGKGVIMFRGIFNSEEAARAAYQKLQDAEGLVYEPPSEGGILFQSAGSNNRLYLVYLMEGGADVTLDGFRIDF